MEGKIWETEPEEIGVWARVTDTSDLPLLINNDFGYIGSWEVSRRRANETNQP